MVSATPPGKPAALRPRMTAAALMLSGRDQPSDGVALAAGTAFLRNALGLKVREYPTTDDPLGSPAARAADLMVALSDPEVAAVFLSATGDDALRVLPHLAIDRLGPPKVVMGWGDASGLLAVLREAGWVTFYGPGLASGLAQASAFPPTFAEHVSAVLCNGWNGEYPVFPWWTRLDGDRPAGELGTKYDARVPFRRLRGEGVVRAELLGGGVEAIEMLVGTPYFPSPSRWQNHWLLLDVASDDTSPTQLRRLLLTLDVRAILPRLGGIAFGRGVSAATAQAFEQVLLETTIACGCPNLPLVTDVAIGRTAPQIVVPFGIPLEIDLDAQVLRLAEPAVQLSEPRGSP